MNKLIIFLLSFFCIKQSLTQVDSLILENIYVVDSSTYNGKKIYTFNDGSWEYENTFRVYEKHSVFFKDDFLIFNEDLFYSNFKNNKVSSYDDWNLSQMNDQFKLSLTDFVRPCAEKKISSGFKFRWGRWHNGVDFALQIGVPIFAVGEGVVRYAQLNKGGYGNLIIIRHTNGLESFYAHLSQINVKINDKVSSGDIIGYSGNTGHSTGPHLHFEFRFYDNPIDPELVFDKKELIVNGSLFRSKPGVTFSFLEKVGIGEGKDIKGVVKTARSRRTISNM